MPAQQIHVGNYVTITSRNSGTDIYKVTRAPREGNNRRAFYYLQLAYISSGGGFVHESSEFFDNVRPYLITKRKAIRTNIKLFDDSNIPGGLRW